ncbi:hypothetical protein CAPTEDRAFT_74467, partial [Capitella teleta]
ITTTLAPTTTGNSSLAATVPPSQFQGRLRALVFTIVSGCKHWDADSEQWLRDGCTVRSAISITCACYCDRLSVFAGAFFVPPNTKRRDAINPVVALVTGVVCFLYIIAMMFAWRVDRKNGNKAAILVVRGRNPKPFFNYLVNIMTGWRRGAGTKSDVMLRLMGSRGNSEWVSIPNAAGSLFQSGAEECFAIDTQAPLGEVTRVLIGHNCLGSPSWYLQHVTVVQVDRNRVYDFVCGRWLKGPQQLSLTEGLHVNYDEQPLKHRVVTKISQVLRGHHLWLGTVAASPHANFNRKMRVTCCLSLLVLTMVISM